MSDVRANPGSATYDNTAKALHWLVVALLIVQFITAWALPHIKVDTTPDLIVNLHFSFGMVIVVIMALRLVHRWMHPVAVAPFDAPTWELLLARATHLGLYVFVIIGPFLGWAAASARSVPVRLFWVLPLPSIAPRKASWALSAGDIHGYAMWTLLGLVAFHALAALFHHFFRHDDVLRRMLPSKGLGPR